MELAVRPAMVFYLDNCMSKGFFINENWGRELLELFSMGVGMDNKLNYSEDDVKEAARAFTGWTVANAMLRYPYGRYMSKFIYDPKDHDDGVKTFLGETGNWNGEDIINIIAKQPATARFVSRHLYNYFVADEPQVPAWQHTRRGTEAIRMLEAEYFRSNYDIRSMLRLLFNADFFKNALCQGQESGRDRRRHHPPGGGFRLPQARFQRPDLDHPLYGARSAQPSHGGGLAHRQGVDR